MHGQYVSNIENLHEVSCVNFEEMFDYIADGFGYGWHISNLVIYDTPKELWNFQKCGAETMENLVDTLCEYCSFTDYGETKWCSTPNGYYSCEGSYCEEAYNEYLEENFVLTRPFQSWGYVEELGV